MILDRRVNNNSGMAQMEPADIKYRFVCERLKAVMVYKVEDLIL